VSLNAAGPDGQTTVVEFFPEGEIFVLAAAILRLPYLVTARLATDARVLMIPAETFRHALASESRLTLALVEVLARHWRLLVTQIKDLKLRPAARRLAGGLVDLAAADRGPATVRLDIDRKLLAQRLGMTPESLSRAFVALRPLGVASEGRTIRVERVEALRDYCDPARLS
jgi:CRP/FNR family transcriptional activator FtrB